MLSDQMLVVGTMGWLSCFLWGCTLRFEPLGLVVDLVLAGGVSAISGWGGEWGLIVCCHVIWGEQIAELAQQLRVAVHTGRLSFD